MAYTLIFCLGVIVGLLGHRFDAAKNQNSVVVECPEAPACPIVEKNEVSESCAFLLRSSQDGFLDCVDKLNKVSEDLRDSRNRESKTQTELEFCYRKPSE
jgi:hypothetical protein